jgi:hypothetical protein
VLKRAAQQRVPADAALRPKIVGILQSGFVLILVPTYTAARLNTSIGRLLDRRIGYR